MSFHDLHAFIEALERQGRLKRVGEPVDPELETTSLSLRALRNGGPALLMERPVGSAHAYLGNLYGHRDRIEAALAGRPLASLRELGELLAAIREPRWPSSLREALGTWHRAPDDRQAVINGMLTVLIDPARLGTRETFEQEALAFVDWLKRSPPGSQPEGVMIAGDPERRARAERARHGIEVDDGTWAGLERAAAKVAVDWAA